MSKVWCEHISWMNGTCSINSGWWQYSDTHKSFAIELSVIQINFCPICGTPRPKEKSLAEKLKYACYPGYHSEIWYELDWESVALAAEEHFKNK